MKLVSSPFLEAAQTSVMDEARGAGLFANGDVDDLERLRFATTGVTFDSLEAKGGAEFCEEGLVGKSERLVDLRYVGQGYELNVDAGAGMMEAFHALHRKRFGYADATRAVEVVTVRVRLTARSETVDLPVSEVWDGDGSQALVKSRSIFFEGAWVESKVYDRAALRAGDRFMGPALITEYSATTVVPPGCEVSVDRLGNLVIEVGVA